MEPLTTTFILDVASLQGCVEQAQRPLRVDRAVFLGVSGAV
jgi:hypothetical protein